MPLFGSDDKEKAKAAAAAEVERLGALSPSDLAAEIMVRVFGPESPGWETMSSNRSGAWAEDVAKAFIPTEYGLGDELRAELYGLVAEGIQRLEHAGLIVLNLRQHGQVTSLRYVVTRAGRAALASGDIAQRLQGSA